MPLDLEDLIRKQVRAEFNKHYADFDEDEYIATLNSLELLHYISMALEERLNT